MKRSGGAVRLVIVLGALWADMPVSTAQRPPLVDSLLTLPYNDLVADLHGSERALRTALLLLGERDDQRAVADLHRLMSTVTLLSGQLDSSVHHGLLATEGYRALGEPLPLGVMLCDLGHGLKRRDLAQAFRYYREGLAILEDLASRPDLARAYNNYAPLHELAGDVDSALYFARKGLRIVEELGDSTGIPYSLDRVASCLLYKERFAEARDLMLRADSIRRATGDVHGLAEQQAYFGDLYEAWGRPAEAIVHFSDAVTRSRALRIPYLERYCLEHLAACYEPLGRFDEALRAARRAHAIQDSLLNERNSRTIIEMEERFQAAEKDRLIDAMDSAAARRRLWLALALTGLVLVVLAALLVVQVQRRRAAALREVAVLRERDIGSQNLVRATEDERRRIATELHDGIGQQLTGLRFRLEETAHKAASGQAVDPAGLQGLLSVVEETGREVRGIAHRMMPRALKEVGLAPALGDMLRNALSRDDMHWTYEHHGMEDRLPEEVEVGLFRIAQELIANVINHSGARQVSVHLLRNKGNVVLMVEDDGKGFDMRQQGKGLGMRSMQERVRLLGGQLDLESGPGTGTVVTVRVPVQRPHA